jgi:hypothetical protein
MSKRKLKDMKNYTVRKTAEAANLSVARNTYVAPFTRHMGFAALNRRLRNWQTFVSSNRNFLVETRSVFVMSGNGEV